VERTDVEMDGARRNIMKKTLIATVVFGAAALTALLAADTAREQKLQQGINLMESKGDLAKAMPLFEDAARSSDRAVAARALLYLGEAQERQSTEKARVTYERIVKEFGNQTETAAAAQKRLAALGGVRASGILAKRLLCSECGDNEVDFSPDGRLMVLTDWESGDLAIRDMSTGQVMRLMAKTGTFKDSGSFGEEPVLSPDLRQIVYFWEVGNKEDDEQLRVMQNEPGGKSRVLISRPGGDIYSPAAWFPDGKSVLVLQTPRDGTRQLARVSVSDGTVKVLKSLEWRASGRPRISPDGRYIVYSARAVNPTKLPPAPTDPTDSHVYILAADGSSESEIVKTAGINGNPVWTPDGKHILFTSDRSGKFDLWSIAVQNGKPSGAVSLVAAEIGNGYAMGMHGGSYYFTNRRAGAEYVNIAEFAPGGNNRSGVAHATESFVGIRPAWSPDGKSIAFKRHEPGSANDYDLVVHSLETGDERPYPTNLGKTGDGEPVWFHDGKAVMTGIHRDGPPPFHRIDLKTGEFKALPATAGASAISPDDKTIYVPRSDPKDSNKISDRILAVDLSTGQEKQIFTMPEPGGVNLRLTPDGRTLVLARQDQKTRATHFARVNVDGTGYREIYTIARADFNLNYTPTKDDRWVLVAKRNDDKNWELIRIPIEGGAPESTGVVLDASLYTRSLDLSPDGSRIAFTTAGSRSDEIWTLDNILSAIK
jgi:Tol biopolymer transport system component